MTSRHWPDALRARFSEVSQARIGLGRSGDALPTQRALEFEYAHALARDAVMTPVDFALLAQAVAPHPTIRVHSAAPDRRTYLRRPDLGRTLGAGALSRLAPGPYDAALVIADGLSGSAIQQHAAPMLAALEARLTGWNYSPVVLAEQARVALGDEVGGALQATMVVVLIGERPGLSVPNSLGIYLTYGPHKGRRDHERNCISNVHAAGLSYTLAAEKLAWLMERARMVQLTGVMLKEDAPSDRLSMAQQKHLDSGVS